jgi:predicted metal-binding membrane protein
MALLFVARVMNLRWVAGIAAFVLATVGAACPASDGSRMFAGRAPGDTAAQ